MRIAVATWSGRLVGGVEDYLARIIATLIGAGHRVMLWTEVDGPLDRAPIAGRVDVPRLCAVELGPDEAVGKLRAWCPDVIFAHGLQDPSIERQLLSVAPAVCLTHNYYGTCISGEKTFKSPVITPCHKTFGDACLFHYFPRRCGGWNPVTMVREYRRQTERLELLTKYKAILTLSSHMQQEYMRHGLPAVHVFDVWREGDAHNLSKRRERQRAQGSRWHLLFAGRMEALKGGLHLIEALPEIVRVLERPIHVTFAGDGRELHRWQERAAKVCHRDLNLSVEFRGWITGSDLDRLFETADLLVVPSLWPEPFGLVGLRAAQCGLPTAAYAVGGIPDWLRSGVNGILADANPPTAESLARAIIECLKDPQIYARLRAGAARISPGLVYEHHVRSLVAIFKQVAGTRAETVVHA